MPQTQPTAVFTRPDTRKNKRIYKELADYGLAGASNERPNKQYRTDQDEGESESFEASNLYDENDQHRVPVSSQSSNLESSVASSESASQVVS